MKDSPLDRLPDLDNANVGMTLMLFITKKLLTGGFFFFCTGGQMVTVNGKDLDIAGTTLSDWLKTTDYDPRVIAVERNLEIVPKTAYSEIVLKDNDIVEVVSFVGGG